MFKKKQKEAEKHLRAILFENPMVIKLEKCKFSEANQDVTIYYDQLKDIFSIVDSQKN